MSASKSHRHGFLETHYCVFLLWLIVAVMAFHFYVFEYDGTWRLSAVSLAWVLGALRIFVYSVALLSCLRTWRWTRIFVLLYWATSLGFVFLGLRVGYMSVAESIASLTLSAFAGGMLYIIAPRLTEAKT